MRFFATMPNLTDRLRQALDRSGKSARAASIEAGLSPRFIADLFAGAKDSVSTKNAEKLSEALGVSPEWLAFGRGDIEEAVIVSDDVAEVAEEIDFWARKLDIEGVREVADFTRFKATKKDKAG